MFFLGIGTAAPVTRYSQAQCWDALQGSAQFAALDRRSRATLQAVLLRDNGILTRHLALNPLEEAFAARPDVLHQRFVQHAPALAAHAAEVAMRRAALDARDVDAVLISTCTGYLCPGLTSYVSERLSLRPDVIALDLVGQGCGAALPNLRTADALLAAGRCDTVLSICVEVCSAAFYLDNDPGVLISACLFGDGAGAAVLSGKPPASGRRVEWKTAASVCYPADREALRFEQRDGMLRNILTPAVPRLAARHAAALLASVLDESGVARGDISTWIWHAGGTRVLDCLREDVGLSRADVERSARILSGYGNLSSAFVYFVLEDALQAPAPDGWWWMSSFGAGFSCHGALLGVSTLGPEASA
jgi:alkylresorcinol/alkylpyrone synthase